MKKSFLGLLIILTVVFVFNILPLTVNASSSGVCGDNLTWTLDDEGTLTISGTGDMNSFYTEKPTWNLLSSNIIKVIIEDGVTSVGDNAFYGYTSIADIEIPNTVTSIGNYAFYNCVSLANIIIGDDLKSIGDYAFYNCRTLTNIEIPDVLANIGNFAFKYCSSLLSMEMPNTVTSIGDGVFSNCELLKSIKIPNSVKSIGVSAFSDCKSLTSIEIPESVTTIGIDAFYCCTALEAVYITNLDAWCNIDFKNSIYAQPLYYAENLYINNVIATEIEIPEDVTSIRRKAFAYCKSLTSIEIPNSVTSIGDYAFSDCTSLQSVKMADSVTSIGNSAFSNCKSLTSIEIPNSVTSIGNSAFSNCKSLTSIEIPSGVTSIGDYAFSDCTSLTSLRIPKSVTSFGKYAFYKCTSLQNAEVSTASIGNYAFSDCTSLTKVKICDGVINIGYRSFYYCKSLTDIEIPESVTSIGYYAFNSCTKLNAVYYGGSPVQWSKISIDSGNEYFTSADIIFSKNDVFGDNLTWTLEGGIYGTLKISGSGDMPECEYSEMPWNYFSSSITGVIIEDGVTNICSSAFSNFTSLKNVKIADSVTRIGENAFYNCKSLESVYITDLAAWCNINFEDEYAQPLYYAFYLIINDKAVTNIEIPNGVTDIGDYAFCNYVALTGVKIPNSVKSIGNGTFYLCRNLTSIEISDSVTSIGNNAFYNCYSLLSIKIPENVTSIGGYAFEGCSGLTSIEIPESVTDIGDYAFMYCSSLTDASLPARFRDNARLFVFCDNLKTINYYCTVTYILNDEILEKSNVTYGENAVLPDTPDGYYYVYTLNGESWNGENITSDCEVTVTKTINTYTVTFTGDYQDIQTVNHGSNAILPDNPEGYHYLYTVSGESWSGENITSDCEVLVRKEINQYTVTFTGDYQDIQTVNHGSNAELPSKVGYTYTFTVDGESWNGTNITKDVIVLVEKTINKYKVTFTGDYQDIQTVNHGSNAILPDDPEDYHYLYTVNGKIWSGENITSDCEVSVRKEINQYTVTFIGDYAGTQTINHGSNAELPTEVGYTYTFTVDGERWNGTNITSDVEVNVTKEINKYTVTFTGDYEDTQIINHGGNAKLPTEEGYTFAFTVDGYEWNGTNITSDVEVLVKKTINIYTITFVGDYSGTMDVTYKGNAILPEADDGYIYAFKNSLGEKWTGESITEDETVYVTLLCDRTEPIIIGLENLSLVDNVFSGDTYLFTFETKNISASKNASFVINGEKPEYLLLKEGENEFNINVTAESGRTEEYRLVINRIIPETLGTLIFQNAVGGDVTLYLENGIKGTPVISVSCEEYGSGKSLLFENCEYDLEKSLVYVKGLDQETEYLFTVKANYVERIVESTSVKAQTGVLLSKDCYILRVLNPYGGNIDHENGVITNLRYAHDLGDRITVDVEVSKGASWALYNSRTSTKPVENNEITGINPGRTITKYIKVISKAGEEYSKVYSISVYRQTKSDAPVIKLVDGKIEISAGENAEIKYTVDGTEPSEKNGIVYKAPFDVSDGVVVRAISKEADKDETSDIVKYTVKKIYKANITESLWYEDKGVCEYMYYIDSFEGDGGVLVVAVYDENGALTGIDFNEEIANEEEFEISGTVSIKSKAAYYKAFIIKDYKSLIPLSGALSNK